MIVIKKDSSREKFDFSKIKNAVLKSADRTCVILSEEDLLTLEVKVTELIKQLNIDEINVFDIHNIVIDALFEVEPLVAHSYKSYREYKIKNNNMFDEIKKESEYIMYEVDRENANSNSSLISTKKSLIAGSTLRELYKEYFLNDEEIEAVEEGFIYVHDITDRFLASINCCLFDLATVMKGGFTMNNLKYTEPTTILSACNVAGDIIMASSAQQYGGHTTPEIDTTLSYYCEKSFKSHLNKNKKFFRENNIDIDNKKLISLAIKDTYNELKQGIQSLEVKLNTVVSARGSFPFTTFTFGSDPSFWATMVSKAILEVRKHGQGQDKKIQIFPKLVFLYDPELHGEGKELEWLFDEAVDCSKKSMYPDYLSPKYHKREGKWVSPMGCRAYLSSYWDENNEIQFIGRGNIGAISLNLPFIYMEAKTNNEDFYQVLDYYLELIRKIHIKTYAYISKMKASCNPLGFMEGGFYKGNLKANDSIKPVIDTFTASFGVTALNELSELAIQKSVYQDNSFALEVMNHINDKVQEFKKEDGFLYAIYGTPAESLCGTQLKQFRKKFGIIDKVSSREYFSNSFHCHVSEEISPFEKQDHEHELFQYFMGGHIQYTRIADPSNTQALKNIIRRGMEHGFYSGVNFDACHCDDCSHMGIDFNGQCPKCGSTKYTEFNRTCGYLGYSKVHGDTRFNDAKMAEIRERKSM